MKEGVNLEEFKRQIENSDLELSENDVPFVLNKEGEKVKSEQFKELIKITGNPEKAKQIYEKIKELENGELKESKLKDMNGELLIVWHGSSRKFEKFDPNEKGEWRWRNKGMHFQSSKETVEQYAEKAKSAWNHILYHIGLEHFSLKNGDTFTDEQEREIKNIFNEITEDLIKNGEDSKFYRKDYRTCYNKEKKISESIRDPGGDYIIYGKRRFGTEWALEIFGGKMPSKENCSYSERFGTYFGNDIGEYKYAALLNIEKPFSEETTDLDNGFENGEESHREQGTDGTILSHKEGVATFNEGKIPGTENSISAGVFDENKIKIIGVETEKRFEIRKEFLKEKVSDN